MDCIGMGKKMEAFHLVCVGEESAVHGCSFGLEFSFMVA